MHVGVPTADRAELRRLADLLIHREEGTFDVTPEGFEAAIGLFSRRQRPEASTVPGGEPAPAHD